MPNNNNNNNDNDDDNDNNKLLHIFIKVNYLNCHKNVIVLNFSVVFALCLLISRKC